MAENQDPRRKIISRSNGFFQDLSNRFRLISRLLMDSRVNPLIKILPVATLAYVVWPSDLLPANPIDDAFVIWIGTTLFVELCPPHVVQEHIQSLNQQPVTGVWQDAAAPSGRGNQNLDGSAAPSGRGDQNPRTVEQSAGSASPTQEGEVVDGEFWETGSKNQK